MRKDGKNVSTDQNSPYIKAGHNITAGGDIIVGGYKTSIANEKKPVVTIKMDGFTYTRGQLDLLFENTGDSSAVIKSLKIAGDEVSIEEFSLSPQQKIAKHANVTGFKVLNEKIDNPKIQLIYKDFITGKKYKTVGLITQESRADGKYNLGKLTDQQLLPFQSNNQLEKKEIEILQAMRAVMKRDNEGNAYLLSTDQTPNFIKVGDRTFIKEGDPLIAREYEECIRSLLHKGFVEQKSRKRFVLTTKGIKWSQAD